MTPTIEEVKKIADECGGVEFSGCIALDFVELQTFVQHWMKEQRESDADVADSFYHHIRQYTTDVPDIGSAIRNNTTQ